MKTIKEFCGEHNIRINVEYADSNPNMDGKHMNHFKVTLKNGKKQFTLYYSQGFRICGDPTAESVLSCLHSDQSCVDMDFDDFCAEMGYDSDSRKAEKIYKAVISQSKKLEQFMGDLLDEFMDCEE